MCYWFTLFSILSVINRTKLSWLPKETFSFFFFYYFFFHTMCILTGCLVPYWNYGPSIKISKFLIRGANEPGLTRLPVRVRPRPRPQPGHSGLARACPKPGTCPWLGIVAHDPAGRAAPGPTRVGQRLFLESLAESGGVVNLFTNTPQRL